MELTIPYYSVCLYHQWTYRPVMYIYAVYTENIHFSTIYLFQMQQECKIFKTIVFGMVQHKTSYDVSWWSVASGIHTILEFNTICKYIQAISIQNKELIYVERQTENTA